MITDKCANLSAHMMDMIAPGFFFVSFDTILRADD